MAIEEIPIDTGEAPEPEEAEAISGRADGGLDPEESGELFSLARRFLPIPFRCQDRFRCLVFRWNRR